MTMQTISTVYAVCWWYTGCRCRDAATQGCSDTVFLLARYVLSGSAIHSLAMQRLDSLHLLNCCPCLLLLYTVIATVLEFVVQGDSLNVLTAAGILSTVLGVFLVTKPDCIRHLIIHNNSHTLGEGMVPRPHSWAPSGTSTLGYSQLQYGGTIQLTS
jgi:hypothetical protein